MAVSIRGLRWAVVGTAVLLLLVLVGLVGYGRYKARGFLAGLPKRLGMSLQQETDNVTYSQSYRGRTVFTVHAAKQIQHADGKYTLRDVGIVMYGKQGGREDRIRGQEFEYDQKNGVLTAVGEVYLDLAGAVAGGDGARPDAEKVVHVKTSGLVYRQKERTAATDALTEFAVNGFSGSSVGAAYAGETGQVVLQSQVRLKGARDGRPMQLEAGRAELNRGAEGQGDVLKLDAARFSQQAGIQPVGEGKAAGGAQTVAADRAVVRETAQGNPERVEAEGHVVLTGEGHGSVSAQRMQMDLNAKGGPRAGHLAGAVVYRNELKGMHEHGVADDARVAFDAAGQPTHVALVGGVALDETTATGERRVLGDKVDFDLGAGKNAKSKTMLRGAVATAADVAVLRVVDVDSHGVKTATEVRAARLVGRFSSGGEVTGLDGAGRTFVERDAPGVKDTSVGDVLRLDFKPGQGGRMELARAAQTGDVETVRQVVAKKAGAADDVTRSKAAAVTFDAASNVVNLTGGVQVADAASLLLAGQVTENQATGDGTAEGGVRVSYVDAAAQKGAEPVHVQAGRAVSHKATGITEFFASPGGKARMWQAGSAVEAPVLDFDRTRKVVVAKGGARAVLVSDTGDPVRVSGSEMTYADAERTVTVAGPVQVVDANGTMSAKEGTVCLLPAGQGAGSLMGGKVERVLVTGSVVVTQPGRKATGERLVYTAADETFVLTGSPKLTDAVNGTVAGSSIRFKRGDESVVVSGEGGRVRTETRVKQ